MTILEWRKYQRRLRPGELVATINGEWAAIPKNGKARWTKTYKDISKQRKQVQPWQRQADATRTKLRNELNAPASRRLAINSAADYMQFKERVLEIKTRYEILKQEYEEWAALWQTLHDIEHAQANANQASLQNALDERDAKRTSLNTCDRETNALYDILEAPPVPEDGNNQARMPFDWWPDRGKLAEMAFNGGVDADRAGHLPGLAGDSPTQTWRGLEVGGGGQSTGTAWLQFEDGTENLIDRVFRKDVLFKTKAWFDPTKWEGDVRTLDDKMPLELDIMNIMSEIANTQGLEHTVRLRENPTRQHIDDTTFSFRMYLNFAGKGDLGDLIKHYASIHQRVPEAMVWYVGEALALWGIAAQSGTAPDRNGHTHGTPPSDWRELVHRDLKPGNVFLEGPLDGLPKRDFYPAYDRPVVGDYGIALKTFPGDPFNPCLYNDGAGTPGYLAPEQEKRIDVNIPAIIDEWRLNESTNVYGCGIVLWCMIMRTTHPPVPVWLGNPSQDTTFDIPAAERAHYSLELCTLVEDCLQYDPTLRPDFQTMLARIRTATAETAGGLNLSQNMSQIDGQKDNSTPS